MEHLSKTYKKGKTQMNLLYFRIGFASNSSSLHSTWHVCDTSKLKDELEDMYFSWDHFVCSSRLGIRKYIAAQLTTILNTRIHPIAIVGVIKYLYPDIPDSEIYSVEVDKNGKKWITVEPDVDHQSVWGLPLNLRSTDNIFPSFEFLEDLENYIVKSNTIIVGGNDNSELMDIADIVGRQQNPRPNMLLNSLLDACGREYGNDVVCVKDKNVWKLFDRDSGYKMRFSFDDNVLYEKSSDPELVDLIISDQCSHGCAYCYRGCAKEGKWAPIDKVKKNIYYLTTNFNVFEIAIGGGNILEYPEFKSLMIYLEDDKYVLHGTIVNTTINHKDFIEKNRLKILKMFMVFRGIAVSVSKREDVETVLKFLEGLDVEYWNSSRMAKLSFQCIPEIMTYEDICDIAIGEKIKSKLKNKYSVTFLGFKHTGRGNSSEFSDDILENNKKNFRRFISDLSKRRQQEKKDRVYWNEKHFLPRHFGVDTQLLENFPELKDTQESWCYDENEGKFSCCVDLVNNYILPSSYSEYKEEYKFDERENIINKMEKVYPKF